MSMFVTDCSYNRGHINELGNKERTLFKLLLLAVTGWDKDKKWGCSLRKCQPDVIFIKSFEKETFSEYI